VYVNSDWHEARDYLSLSNTVESWW